MNQTCLMNVSVTSHLFIYLFNINILLLKFKNEHFPYRVYNCIWYLI